MKLLIRSYHTIEFQDFQEQMTCYFIIERQLNIEYIRVVAVFVLRKLGLKKMYIVLQTTERHCFGNSLMAIE